MLTKRIAFIGAGNMAQSIIGGLLAQQMPAVQIIAADPVPVCLEKVSALGVQITTNNVYAVNGADVVVLAVKPQVMKSVTQTLGVHLADHAVVVSIAAGITTKSLRQWLGNKAAIVRCMPNTPALVGLGATALFAATGVNNAQQQLADQILRSVGIAQWVPDEAQLDAVTALSGSGPAYFFLVMEALQAAGEKLGLSAELSRQLTLQTALGAAHMACNSDVDLVELRRRVTSPGGTTERAIQHFEQNGLRAIFLEALNAAAKRSAELAKDAER